MIFYMVSDVMCVANVLKQKILSRNTWKKILDT